MYSECMLFFIVHTCLPMDITKYIDIDILDTIWIVDFTKIYVI